MIENLNPIFSPMRFRSFLYIVTLIASCVAVDTTTAQDSNCGLLHRATRTGYFDNVIPPALPPDWIATNAQGPPPFWTTSNSGLPTPPAYTLPNAAFIDDPAVVSDKRLDSFLIPYFESCCLQLSFRHNFNFDASPKDPTVGFDGGVLELSTDNGNTFHYIDANAFVSGGYNRTISSDRGSPIAGFQAWSGNSGGFITTVVNLGGLPPAQTSVRFRWRMASDISGSGDGWRIDNVIATWCAGPPGTPVPLPTARPRPTPAPRPGP